MRLTRELRGEHEHIADAHARVGEARVDPHAPSGITSIGLLDAQPYSLPLPLLATASSTRLLHAASLTPISRVLSRPDSSMAGAGVARGAVE